MALTVRVDGSVVGGQPNTATAQWWNDYHDLLTGLMTDQDLTPKTDLILAPIGPAPTAAPVAAPAAGAGLGIGVYQYYYTYCKQGENGETLGSPVASVTTTSGNQQVALSGITVGPTGTVSRHLYRTKVGGSTFYFLATLGGNAATTYTDTIADSSLVSTQSSYSTFGGRLIIKDATGATKSSLFSDGHVSFDGGALISDGAGNLSASKFLVGGQPAIILGTGSYAGFHLYVGPNQPSGWVKGDVWLKTPF
jgi:hypothetical protein